MTERNESEQGYVVCLKNDGYPASLEVRKLYKVLPDDQAARHRLVRVVDESGEDYLYPESFFAVIELSEQVAQALALAA